MQFYFSFPSISTQYFSIICITHYTAILYTSFYSISNHLFLSGHIVFRSSLEAAYREMAEMKTKLTEAADEANTESLAAERKARKDAEQLLVEERKTWEIEKLELESRIANIQVSSNIFSFHKTRKQCFIIILADDLAIFNL